MTARSEAGRTQVRRTPVLDEVVRGDEAVVLVDSQVLRVSPLARSLRELAADWTELEHLAERLVQRHGAPEGEPIELLERVVADLEDAGLVETRDGESTG